MPRLSDLTLYRERIAKPTCVESLISHLPPELALANLRYREHPSSRTRAVKAVIRNELDAPRNGRRLATSFAETRDVYLAARCKMLAKLRH
jgi:hypothetical protein